MQKFLYIALFLFLLTPVTIPAAAIPESQTRIHLVQLTFEESIADLSRIFGVEIDIAGNIGEMPQGKFSLDLAHATFEQSIKEAIRKANLQSHALIFDQKNKTAKVLILKAGESNGRAGNDGAKSFLEEDMKPLSREQLDLLAQNDQGLSKQDDQPLTQEQLKHLREQSAAIEAEMEEGKKPLTREQMELLKVQSDEMEMEIKNQQQALTPEQMRRLQEQSAELEAERKKDQEPLSEEQLLLLQEQEGQP